MPKRFLFLLIVCAIVVLLYKIAVTEYQSLRAQTRMGQYQQEIAQNTQDIATYKRRFARNDTTARRVAQKKKTGTVRLPSEEVIVFSSRTSREINRLNVEEVFRVELDVDNSSIYSALSIPQKWNRLILGY